MGTRGIAALFEEDGSCLVKIFSQYESYPREPGLGHKIYRFFAGRGIRYDFNDLAAQFVSELKGGEPGSIFLYAPDYKVGASMEDRAVNARTCGADYFYAVSDTARGFTVSCFALVGDPADTAKLEYEGSPDGLAERYKYQDRNRAVDDMERGRYGRYLSRWIARSITLNDFNALTAAYAEEYRRYEDAEEFPDFLKRRFRLPSLEEWRGMGSERDLWVGRKEMPLPGQHPDSIDARKMRCLCNNFDINSLGALINRYADRCKNGDSFTDWLERKVVPKESARFPYWPRIEGPETRTAAQ